MNGHRAPRWLAFRRHAAASLLLLIGAAALPVRAEPDPTSPELQEHVLKAGFLFNFARYTEWPATAFERADSPISIGVVGTDPFGSDLERALREKVARNRPFAIQRFRAAKDIRPCHILFVASSEVDRLYAILERVRAWPVLTVGEVSGFCRAGGVVNILIEGEHPRLEINPDAAARAGLTIDAKLLKAAAIVREP